ncbi:hypothetical protein CSN78_000953 [Salmonella enterica subsp. diarizonae]|nr:hypothetical protein [Salmonella enterica]EDT8783451.1 hypothetical protein [Salmonella enterica subsp. diarizonae]
MKIKYILFTSYSAASVAAFSEEENSQLASINQKFTHSLIVRTKSRSYTRFETSQNVFLCPQMLLAQLIHSINCDEHDGQGSHVINHEMSSLVVPR